MQYFTQEKGVCIKILDFIEEFHETAKAITVFNQPWQNMIFLFVKYLYFAHAVVEDLGFTKLLTSQVISVAFYNEHEESDKFCPEALILA